MDCVLQPGARSPLSGRACMETGSGLCPRHQASAPACGRPETRRSRGGGCGPPGSLPPCGITPPSLRNPQIISLCMCSVSTVQSPKLKTEPKTKRAQKKRPPKGREMQSSNLDELKMKCDDCIRRGIHPKSFFRENECEHAARTVSTMNLPRYPGLPRKLPWYSNSRQQKLHTYRVCHEVLHAMYNQALSATTWLAKPLEHQVVNSAGTIDLRVAASRNTEVADRVDRRRLLARHVPLFRHERKHVLKPETRRKGNL